MRPSRIEKILLQRDLALKSGDRGKGLLILRLDLGDLDSSDGPRLKAQVEDPLGFAVVAGGRMRDLELAVERPQRDVDRGHAGHDREDDAAPCLLGGEYLRPSRLRGSSYAAEDIDLPVGVELELIEVERVAYVEGNGPGPASVSRWPPVAAAAPSCGKNVERAVLNWPRNCSIRVAAMRTS